MAKHVVKPLPYANDALKGIGSKTMEIHHDKLYAGYVNKRNEIEEALAKVDRTKANQIYSDMRGMKHEETFAANGQILHEIYFSIMGGDGQPKGEVVDKIKEDFGTFAAWEEDFKASGMCARGWVVLAFDPTDGRLHNFIGDSQNQGGVWGTFPVLNVDTYEHSYFIDYGSDRKAYLEAFMRNINWDEVNRRFVAAAQMTMARK
ncbi:MAG TPA: Fe-Mn family superoxide dismutase [Acidobacteriota bacterium]|nr:Fe-Mn family superoxide dismutase [Acidobacteriota bacterium]